MKKKIEDNLDEVVINDDSSEIDDDTNYSHSKSNTEDEETDEFVDTDDEGNELSGKDQLKKLREKIKLLEKEKREYMEGWQRANADYANREGQISKERSEFVKLANKKLITDILPTLDNYDAAKANTEAWNKVEEGWRMGIEYIFSSLVAKLESNGLKQYGDLGDSFSSADYEAVEIIETDDSNKDNKVAQVMQKGYKIGESILRPARVKVYQLKA